MVNKPMVQRIFSTDGNQHGCGDRPSRCQFSGNRGPAVEARRGSGGDVRTASKSAASLPVVIPARGPGCGGDRAGSLSVALPAFAAGEIARESAGVAVQGRAQSGIEESPEGTEAFAGRSGSANGLRAGSGRAGGGLAATGSSSGRGESAAGTGPVLPFAARRRSSIPGNRRSAGNLSGSGGELARKILVAPEPGRRMQGVSCCALII